MLPAVLLLLPRVKEILTIGGVFRQSVAEVAGAWGGLLLRHEEGKAR